MDFKHLVPLTALLLAPLAAAPAANATAPKPNILVIYVDDLGYGDVECYNLERSKILIPHLDKLASQGMRFADAHSTPAMCTPSRYSLLTGRYNWRTRLQTSVLGAYGNNLIDKWKYIAPQVPDAHKHGGDQSQPVQLYNLSDDLSETKNLAATMPEKVAEMTALPEKLVSDGRSTAGAVQRNDVEERR
jgi:arylsulfatase A-like enzyme